ncbi:hypothetical protein CAEBREN_01023 [Caenorhabditis brenneri]|uniref:Uncharacterized protein n=1 Tax=Caenorhabditis brenneri TaxID=135651 RepID=G0PHF6_CAEBE|nr:hypothetical protein CAEBREN_01023 [Caenorhabditis brenneri]
MSDLEMSLFNFLKNLFTLNKAYECPAEIKELFYPKHVLGAYFLITGIILILLYIPCFVVMLTSKSRNPAFRIMIILAVFDMINLSVNSVSTGIFDIFGTSFCQYPRLIFIIGCIGDGTWMAGCAACILLAMDRCVEINSKFFLSFLFHKNYFRGVQFVVAAYWFYAVMFCKPLLFSAEYSSWFFDPKIGKDPKLYHNIAHTVNNLVVSAATTCLYIYMCIFLYYKKGKVNNSMWVNRNRNQTLYLLCFITMLNRDLLRYPAFKIMVSLALCDIPSVCVNSIATGIMGYHGIVFCDYPRLIFFLGANGFGLWLGCSLSCITLAVCRISELNSDLNIRWIFQAPFIYFLMLLFFLAPFYGVFFTKPVIFRPEYMSWFFDPGTGLDPSYYYNLNQPINNAALTIITLSLYAYLVSYLIRKGNNIESVQFSKTQRQVILQAAIICFFHSITSFVYVYMQFFYSPEWFIVVAQVGWQICTENDTNLLKEFVAFQNDQHQKHLDYFANHKVDTAFCKDNMNHIIFRRRAQSLDISVMLKLGLKEATEFGNQLKPFKKLPEESKKSVLAEYFLAFLLIDQGCKTSKEPDQGIWSLQNESFMHPDYFFGLPEESSAETTTSFHLCDGTSEYRG